MKRIYLDYAATSPVKPAALKAMLPFMAENFGNPSSVHSFGREARFALSEAREKVARFFNVLPEEVVFTSGGSESDNLAIRGIIANQIANNPRIIANQKPHIITTQIEHHAVLHTIEALEKEGKIEASYIKPEKNGVVKVEDIIKAIKENTILISVMYANNEIGTVQPVAEIADALFRHSERSEESSRGADARSFGRQRRPQDDIVLHTDGVQAVEYLDCDIKKLGVDLFSFSGHKFGAPKGVGGLIVKKGVKLASQIKGGEQEYGRRAGTENIAAIAAMAAALPPKNPKSEIVIPSDSPRREAEESLSKSKGSLRSLRSVGMTTKDLRDYMIKRIEKEIPKVTLNGDREKRLPNNINFSFEGIEGEGIVLGLDEAGIAVSTGSACASKSLEPSYVIMAISNGDHTRAHSAVRFTLGEKTTKSDIDYTIEELIKIIKRLREMSPFWNNNKFEILNPKS